jgi:predicted DCC family thiol-disulfide oxidoreductase YuxK
MRVESEPPKSTVYFDGSCPLCRAEIGYYRRPSGFALFFDVAESAGLTPEGLAQQHTMERFLVRAGDDGVVSGAAAFVELWTRLPKWRWAARAASLPGVLAVLELGYRMFLPVRPFLSRLFGRIPRLQADNDRPERG